MEKTFTPLLWDRSAKSLEYCSSTLLPNWVHGVHGVRRVHGVRGVHRVHGVIELAACCRLRIGAGNTGARK